MCGQLVVVTQETTWMSEEWVDVNIGPVPRSHSETETNRYLERDESLEIKTNLTAVSHSICSPTSSSAVSVWRFHRFSERRHTKQNNHTFTFRRLCISFKPQLLFHVFKWTFHHQTQTLRVQLPVSSEKLDLTQKNISRFAYATWISFAELHVTLCNLNLNVDKDEHSSPTFIAAVTRVTGAERQKAPVTAERHEAAEQQEVTHEFRGNLELLLWIQLTQLSWVSH